ncbi:efflux RND transporter permease subunit [Sodalis glossinidius]|uniref:efflux RND transporter permease subunit n=1 Tax=Sodalis glossinidius TaxID=63612 RepID=UPI0002E5A785|nr:efflux RND transporter permease subunit [Sodalis glossinidius]
MANFFVDRPIFSWVLAIIVCLTGVMAIISLPIEQYPRRAPPTIRISSKLSRRLCANAGKYRRPDYRTEHDRP